MKMTLNEEIEYLQSGNWYDKVRAVLPTDEYLKLGWAIGDILETLELFRSLAPEPQTNLDRIRAMGDEELAELLISADYCEGCEYCDKVGICRYYEAHPDGVLADGRRQAARKWLQQLAKEDT